MRRLAALATCTVLCLTTTAQAAPDPPPAGANDFGCEPSAAHPRPVVLVHGLGANMQENWSYHSPRIKAAGYCVFALTYGVDPRTALFPVKVGGTIPMERSAPELAAFVDRVLAATGAEQVDLVGHSEGTVMPRYYLERLGGAPKVKRFVALTPLWRGTEVGGAAMLRDLAKPLGLAAPLVNLVASLCGSCPQFLRGSPYLNDLNADGEAIPGIEHTNVVTRYDELVTPPTSGVMRDGGTNIILQDVCPADLSEHLAIAFDPVVTQLILNALDPEHAQPVRC
jgi:triacylglycerol lipase